MAIQGFLPPKPEAGSAKPEDIRKHTQEIAAALRVAMQGGLNVVTEVTLAAGTTTTVMTDPRLTLQSFVQFDPLTAHAATELYGGTMYVLLANRNKSTWTITHANAATTDRTFRVIIIG